MDEGSESNQGNPLGPGVLLQYETRPYGRETGTSGFRPCTDSTSLRVVGVSALCWVSRPAEPVACGSGQAPQSRGASPGPSLGARGAFPGSPCDTCCIPLHAAAAAGAQLVATLCLSPARCSLHARAVRSLRPALRCEGLR